MTFFSSNYSFLGELSGFRFPPHRLAIGNEFNRAQLVGAQNGRTNIGGALEHFRAGMAKVVIGPDGNGDDGRPYRRQHLRTA
jgi:hypothetical protein